MMCTYPYKQETGSFTSVFAPSVRLNYIAAEPADRQPTEKLPMIIYLHGAGKRIDDIDVLKAYKGFIPMLDEGLPVRAVVLCPQITNGHYVWNHLIEPLMELIRTIAARYDADPDRISIMGQSMGGYGTWEAILTYPAFFSAAAPMCGGGISWRAPALIKLPIRAFHGDSDEIVPYSTTIEMVDAVNRHGGCAECLILHGMGHAICDFVIRETNLLAWMIAQTRSKSQNMS